MSKSKGTDQFKQEMKPFACNQCSKAFAERGSLRRHLKLHTGQNTHVCDQCGKCFPDKYGLERHFRMHMGIKPYKCEICNKMFSESGNMKQHMKTHSGEKDYCCGECGKQFTRKHYLRDHMKTHAIYEPHICEICGEGFATNRELDRHSVAHIGEIPYSCDECGKLFKRPVNLMQHMKQHPGSKAHFCVICRKRFKEIEDLKTHLEYHTARELAKANYESDSTQNRPFSTTAQETRVELDQQSNSPSNVYICEVCGEHFTEVVDLKMHLIQIHIGGSNIALSAENTTVPTDACDIVVDQYVDSYVMTEEEHHTNETVSLAVNVSTIEEEEEEVE